MYIDPIARAKDQVILLLPKSIDFLVPFDLLVSQNSRLVFGWIIIILIYYMDENSCWRWEWLGWFLFLFAYRRWDIFLLDIRDIDIHILLLEGKNLLQH